MIRFENQKTFWQENKGKIRAIQEMKKMRMYKQNNLTIEEIKGIAKKHNQDVNKLIKIETRIA